MRLEKRSVFGWPATAAGKAACANGMVVHYDGSNQGLAGKDHKACQAYWKNTRKFHMGPARGWVDIGYAYSVCPHGIVLEGRGWQRQQAAQPGGNSTWTSCTFMSGPDEKPTQKQIDAFLELRADLRGKGLGAAVRPHSAFVSTSCCGNILRGLITDGTLAKPVKAGWRILQLKKTRMSGEDVKAVQRALNANGAKPRLSVDGVFGPATDDGLRDFQGKHGLLVDGIVGSKTRAKLGL